ncbi:alpha/beta fold hydrolase [Candidatus Entotheonella palauensis]|uniref:AB hydrolase-1 domain-containing protein n=1 Tax=Candidatus Entotheonella gemina TaxID=1429439 RepID=W4LXQ1_9BACT|nr:alpha/beta hydrolase [Candidatus Entotheonella palauensis]ETX02705.1 MAG: hypothetical protein ETSY2_34985 [Candidatus Entotheonella gemina]
MARIDRLPEASKTALQVASVIGREFSARLVERVSVKDHEAVQALGELRSVELIYQKAIFPELAYMFKHALTHDVAYESLLRQRRKGLHERVGEVIEKIYADRLPEFYETLAWHYEQGEIWPKAVDYHLRAADQARARFAYPEAVDHCTEAINIVERYEGTIGALLRAHENLGDLLSLIGQVEAANQAFDRALGIADTPATRQRIANKYHRLGTTVRNGARIAYYEHGSEEQTLLLMFPALYSKTMWQPIVEVLCQEFRVIVVEPRGAGKSDPITETYFLRDHVEDARAVVEATGNRPVVFVGISAAGALAVHFAAAYPHLVDKLVLVGSRPTLQVEEVLQIEIDPQEMRQRKQRRQERRENLLAGDHEQAIRSFLNFIYSEPGSRNLIEVLTQNAMEAQPKTIVDFLTVEDPDRELRPLLPMLQAPTLVLHGEMDCGVPVEAGRYLADHIAGAQFYLFKHRGHVPMFTATSEFARVVRNFIRTGRPT